MHFRHTMVPLCLYLAGGCTSQSPTGADAADALSATASYVLEFRRHFFPEQATLICLEEEGWPAASIERQFQRYHLPVSMSCTPDDAPTDSPVDPRLVVTLGPGRAGLRWSPAMAAPGFPQEQNALADVRYADSRGDSASFSCTLQRRENGWRVEECFVVEGWTGPGLPADAEIAGCWSFHWAPISAARPLVLPSEGALTLVPDSVDSTLEGFAMAPLDSADWTDWGLGWRWARGGSHLIHLMGGGHFEGIYAQLLWDGAARELRGVGSLWTDVIYEPILPDPDWRVAASSRSCDGEVGGVQ